MAMRPARDGAKSQPQGRLSDLAYARLLESLFDGRLPVGAFLSQSDLVELVGVPVGPLRDALRILEAEGILVIRPRSGIEFVKPGIELTRSTFQYRSIVELAAVRIFAEVGDADLIERMHVRHLNAATGLETQGLTIDLGGEIEDLESVLHHSIIETLGNPLIEVSYRRMHNYLRLVRIGRRMTVPLVLRSINEHLAIIEAFRARDPERAEAALQAHFDAALQRHMTMFLGDLAL